MKFLRHLQITFLFAWYDLWIGAFWDRKKRRLFVFPLPCVGVCIDLGEPGLISRWAIDFDTGHTLPNRRVLFRFNP